MASEVSLLGLKILEKIAEKCVLDKLEYLGYEGLVKAVSRECNRIGLNILDGCFKAVANGEELFINCLQGKELYIKTKHNLSEKTLHYEELLGIRSNLNEEIVKNISRLFRHKLEVSENIVTFTPWSTEALHFNPLENTLTKVLMKPLGTYRSLETNVFKLVKKHSEEVLLKDGVEISAKNTYLGIKKNKYSIKIHFKDENKNTIYTDNEEKYFAARYGKNIVYGLLNNYVVFEGFTSIKVELDFLGGTLWYPAFLTVNSVAINFDEKISGTIPLWISYCSKTHCVSVHTYPSGKFNIKEDAIEIKEFNKAYVALHRGCWSKGGIDWFSVANVLKPLTATSPSNVMLVELQPKHVIVTGLSFKKKNLEITLYNMLDREVLARIKIPWKIVNAEKKSVIKELFLGSIDYDYNVAYVPLSSNEIVKASFEISPFAIVRT